MRYLGLILSTLFPIIICPLRLSLTMLLRYQLSAGFYKAAYDVELGIVESRYLMMHVSNTITIKALTYG